jgi:hypothetical protein
MDSVRDTAEAVGCPIRKSTDQGLLAAPHGLSQRAASFIASQCQGIHQMPFIRLISTCTLRTPRAGANPHIGDLREDASHKTQPYEPPKQQLRHRHSRCHRRITLSGHPLVTYPLHNVNRSRIGAHTMRKHKPLPSRDASRNRLPGA